MFKEWKTRFISTKFAHFWDSMNNQSSFLLVQKYYLLDRFVFHVQIYFRLFGNLVQALFSLFGLKWHPQKYVLPQWFFEVVSDEKTEDQLFIPWHNCFYLKPRVEKKWDKKIEIYKPIISYYTEVWRTLNLTKYFNVNISLWHRFVGLSFFFFSHFPVRVKLN